MLRVVGSWYCVTQTSKATVVVGARLVPPVAVHASFLTPHSQAVEGGVDAGVLNDAQGRHLQVTQFIVVFQA